MKNNNKIKQLLKEIFKEVINEELIPLLIEQNKNHIIKENIEPNIDRNALREKILNGGKITSNDIQKVPPMYTMAEGSKLPDIELNENTILHLLNPKK